MPDLLAIQNEAIASLACEAFGNAGCSDFGIVVLKGAKTWSDAQEMLPFNVCHDERGAPFALGVDGHEITDVKLSCTDEDDYLACAWARTMPESPLLGVGVDLTSIRDFDKDQARMERLILPLFSRREHELAQDLRPDDTALSYAMLFGAKEAAFKSTAQPLRQWYRTHDEELAFEVRHFSMAAPSLERGEQRDGAAQRAMERMGIDRLKVFCTQVEGMALVVAIALSDSPIPKDTHGTT